MKSDGGEGQGYSVGGLRQAQTKRMRGFLSQRTKKRKTRMLLRAHPHNAAAREVRQGQKGQVQLVGCA